MTIATAKSGLIPYAAEIAAAKDLEAVKRLVSLALLEIQKDRETVLPWMGHFHSTLVDGADITITGCPFRPRYAFLLSEGAHGAHGYGWDIVTQAVHVGHYLASGVSADNVMGEGAGYYGSWITRHDDDNWSAGSITSFTSDGFVTRQDIGATAGFVARVQYILFP